VQHLIVLTQDSKIMSNKTFYRLFTAFFLFLVMSVANAFPTKVKLTQDADYYTTEGITVIVKTNKGTIEVDNGESGLYKSFTNAKKGTCFILETESESTVDFNKKVGLSKTSTVTKTKC
jgi:hypothetical protein